MNLNMNFLKDKFLAKADKSTLRTALKTFATVTLIGITPFIRMGTVQGTVQSTALLAACYVVTIFTGLFLLEEGSVLPSFCCLIALSYAAAPHWTLRISPLSYYVYSYLCIAIASFASSYLCDKYKLSFIYRAILLMFVDSLVCIATFSSLGVKLKYLIHSPLESATCLAFALAVNFLLKGLDSSGKKTNADNVGDKDKEKNTDNVGDKHF